MSRKKPKDVIQKHHITYEPEWIVPVFQTEHFYITCLQRFKSLSPGAKEGIRYILDTKPTREMNQTP
jgi:hypothetical protein